MSTNRLRTIGYWLLTLVIAWEMAAGATWDLLRIDFVRGVFDELGYPHYLLLIIGAWKLPCASVLLAPRLARLKEWAYAGAFFNYTGAAASHLLVGEGAKRWVGPAVFAAMTLASWALRPADRRLAAAGPVEKSRPAAWAAALGAAAAMTVLALLTLPK
jgi:hypothetical protein